jgi:hypothetical protein
LLPSYRVSPITWFAAGRAPPDGKSAYRPQAHAEVPFFAEVREAAPVVLARYSAPDQVLLITDSGAVGGTHGTNCRARYSMPCSRDRWPLCLLPPLHPRHFGDVALSLIQGPRPV